VGTNYKNIIWDWNGTLLNDITICIKSMNILLKERTLPLISEDKYRDIFTFPVRNYYEQLGFDFLVMGLEFYWLFLLIFCSFSWFEGVGTIMNFCLVLICFMMLRWYWKK
jgi:hypothetical protein